MTTDTKKMKTAREAKLVATVAGRHVVRKATRRDWFPGWSPTSGGGRAGYWVGDGETWEHVGYRRADVARYLDAF